MLTAYVFRRKCGKCLQILKEQGAVENAIRRGLIPHCRESRVEHLISIRRQYAIEWSEEVEAKYRAELNAHFERLGVN